MDKKNLNIAYLNGAEGLVRKAASSGGSGGGDNQTNAKYYRIDWDKAYEIGYVDRIYNNGDSANNPPYNTMIFVLSLCQICKIYDGLFTRFSYIGNKIFLTETRPESYQINRITAVLFNPIEIYGDKLNTLKDAIAYEEFTIDYSDAFIEITKEEFYAV